MRGGVEEYARGNSSGIWRHLCVRQHCDQSGSGDWDVCDARSLPWTGFTLSALPSCFVFRASYGDADPKRLTDVKVRLFPVAASVAKQALTTIANTRKRSYLPGLAAPNGGFTSSTPSCIRRLVRSLRLTGLTSGELGLFGLVGSGQAGRHYEMSGLGSQRSGAVLLAGLANGPRTHPWPAGLDVRYLPGWLGDRQTGQSGCSVMALAGDQEVSELAV
jgi:hypothetical protein